MFMERNSVTSNVVTARGYSHHSHKQGILIRYQEGVEKHLEVSSDRREETDVADLCTRCGCA